MPSKRTIQIKVYYFEILEPMQENLKGIKIMECEYEPIMDQMEI